jgi:MOSC domain-containing protein YiiM
MPKVIAVCAGKDRRKPKTELEAALFVKGKGIYGDGHFGMGERQVSLLRSEDISQAENSAGFPFPPGSLAENLVIAGLPEDLSPGQTIRIGESVILIVVEKGKKPGEPHSYDYRGWSLLPEKGYFLRVEEGGRVKPEDAAILV